MKKSVLSFAVVLIVSLVINGLVFGAETAGKGTAHVYFDSLSLKKLSNDPPTESGEGKIYYRGTIGGGIDNNAVLMLHMDGTGGTFTDDSDTPHTPTAQGGATQTSTPANTNLSDGVNVASFDGTDDYLSIPDHADWDFGSGDFTIDYWVKIPVDSVGTHVSQWRTSDNFDITVAGSGKVTAYMKGTSVFGITSSTSVDDNIWHHIALVRNGNAQYLFIDGIKEGTDGSFSGSLPDSTEVLSLGSESSANFMNGYLDEVRISKGIARWTSNFTPPSKNYTTDIPEGLYFKDENGTVTPIIEILP